MTLYNGDTMTLEKNTPGDATVSGLRALDAISADVERQVRENRKRFDDAEKTVKDFRRIFDAKSALMNQAIFNDHSPAEIKKETIQTIAVLVEILARLPGGPEKG